MSIKSGLIQRPFFLRAIPTVIANTTDVITRGGVNRVDECELGVTAIEDRTPAGGQIPLEHAPFVLFPLARTARDFQHRIEQEQENQHAVLVHEPIPVAGAVPGGAHVAPLLQQGRELIKVLQPRNVAGLDLLRWILV